MFVFVGYCVFACSKQNSFAGSELMDHATAQLFVISVDELLL
jgi:hypothetical protein